MTIRKAIVAGQFYPAAKEQCLAELAQCLGERTYSGPLPGDIAAGIVPHAGWVFSGSLAAMAFSAIKKLHEKVDTFVLFGAVHSWYGSYDRAAVYDSGAWSSPLGEVSIDTELAGRIVSECGTAEPDPPAHAGEHSIEVQIPFIKYLWPEAKIVPVMVMPVETAIQLGEEVAKIVATMPGRKIVCIGSTDLTHYGPGYGFSPAGTGTRAASWANDNDMLFVNAALQMDAAKLIDTAAENHNACGAGAAAATVAAARAMGKTQGVLMAHANSNEIMQAKFRQSGDESVGYAAIVY